MYKSKIDSFNLKNKRVFLRADLNVPTKDVKILNDFKLVQTLKTIDLIIKKGGKVILATHIGRPEKYDANLSTKILVEWFKAKKYKVNFVSDLNDAYNKSLNDSYELLLLENLRFFKGEKKQDKIFAKQLSKLADFYINDAFAVSHRDDTSITILAEEFPKDHKSMGLLMEEELNALNKLLNPEKPFLLILGGSKIKDKIQILSKLVDKIDTVLLCPAIVFSFLKSQHKSIGNSFVDESIFGLCNEIEKKAKSKNIKIIYPVDYQVAENDFNGPLAIIKAEQFNGNDFGISIGPNTATLFENEINKAKTIFFNGLPGDLNRPETLQGAKSIFHAMIKSHAHTIVGGGDSVAAVYSLGLEKKINYLSTAGGAILAFLTNKKLPGLKFLID